AKGLGCIPAPTLTRSGSPSCCRSLASAWLMADCVLLRRSAARVTLRSSMSTSNTTSRLRSRRRRSISFMTRCAGFVGQFVEALFIVRDRSTSLEWLRNDDAEPDTARCDLPSWHGRGRRLARAAESAARADECRSAEGACDQPGAYRADGLE